MTHAAGIVTELYRYPVKSMAGERLDTVRLDDGRVRGDRTYALHHEDGKLGSGKNSRRFRRVEGLLNYRARYDGDTPVVTFPDGRDLRADAPGFDAALAAALGVPVRLSPEDGGASHGRPGRGRGSHLDAAPVHILTTASLRWLSAELPDAAIAVARFRPNIVVDLPGDTPIEDAWVGRRLRIGGAEVAVRKRVERCVMTTAAQGALPHDARVLKTLTARHDMTLGVYVDVRTPGHVSTGDPVELI